MTALSRRAARRQFQLIAGALVLLGTAVVGLAFDQEWLVVLSMMIAVVALWSVIGFALKKLPDDPPSDGYDYSLMGHWERVAMKSRDARRLPKDSAEPDSENQ